MVKVLQLLLSWALANNIAFAQSSINPLRSFELENGVMISAPDGEKIWYGGGDVDPTVFPGIDVPIGSTYRRTNGDIYAKTGAGALDWTLEGLGSAVVTQTADFGKAGNAAANSYLDRAGGVPSNIAGVPVVVSSGFLRVVACGQENIGTFTMEVYQHEGDSVNAVLLHSFTITSSRSGYSTGLNIAVTQGKQISIKTNDAVKNIGCSIGIKGLSI